MKKYFPIFASVIFIFCFSCNKYSSNPDLRLARDFIDAYYVFANQKDALPLTTGFAHEKIKNEIELLKDVSHRTESYRSRDILFDLKKEMKQKNQTIYLYELTIMIRDMKDQKKMINITIDKEKNLVKYFGEIQ